MDLFDATQKKGVYKGIPYESFEELHILYYLFDLMDKNIVKKIERSPSYILSDKKELEYTEIKQLKTKQKIASKKHLVIREHTYEGDFKVVFDMQKGEKFLYCSSSEGKEIKNNPFFFNGYENGDPVVYLEVKPDYNLVNNMERIFHVNQKWVYEKYKVFFNLIKPIKLFSSTFYPKAFLITPTGKEKKITKKIKLLEEFLGNIE